MAGEAGRIIKRKRIKLPTGDTLDIPVISQITFSDDSDRGQEIEYTIDNTTDSDRGVHIASIPGYGAPTDESGGGDASKNLKVERIDKFRLLDASDRGQETFPEPDSKTVAEPPDAPPYFTTHEKTHIVKYIKRNDDDTEDQSIFIKSELIDVWDFRDDAERGQETKLTLFNPPDNQQIDGLRVGMDDEGKTTISVASSVEEITTGVGGDGDPVRTDPFQNIVDWGPIPFFIANCFIKSPHSPDPNYILKPGGDCFPIETISGVFTGGPGYILGYRPAAFIDAIVTPDGQSFQPPTPSVSVLNTIGFVIEIFEDQYDVSVGTFPTPPPWDTRLGIAELNDLTPSLSLSGVTATEQHCLAKPGGGGQGQTNYLTPAPGVVQPGVTSSILIDLNWTFTWNNIDYHALGCLSNGKGFFRVYYVPVSNGS